MKDTIYVILTTYAYISIVAGVIGYLDSSWVPNPCVKQTRGRLLVPAYKLGCYLGEEIK